MPPMSLVGIVTSVGKMAKTATVTVSRNTQHPRTRKVIERSKKYLTHDPTEELRLGDKVVIRNCPPVSARKRFQFESFVLRSKTFEIPPADPSPPQPSL